MDLNPDTNQPVPTHEALRSVWQIKCLKTGRSEQSSRACHQQITGGGPHWERKTEIGEIGAVFM